MLKRPASFVKVTRSVFVESWTRRTVAPGKRASLESVTVPVIEPRPDCAYAPTLKSKTNIASPKLVYISASSHFASRLCTKNSWAVREAQARQRAASRNRPPLQLGARDCRGALSRCERIESDLIPLLTEEGWMRH